MIRLLKSAFSSQAGRGVPPCLTTGMLARRGASVSEHVCWLSSVSHWSSCTNAAVSRLGRPAGRGPVCSCTILHYCNQKASGSDLARGHQLLLSEGFMPAGLCQTYPTAALGASETSNSSSLLLCFQVGSWLLLTLVQCVVSACSLLVTSRSPPTCNGACLGGKASPVFPILYAFLMFLFQHFTI